MAKLKAVTASETTYVPTDNFIETTVGQAREISKQVGARIFWRPNGVINHAAPDSDVAHIVEAVVGN